MSGLHGPTLPGRSGWLPRASGAGRVAIADRVRAWPPSSWRCSMPKPVLDAAAIQAEYDLNRRQSYAVLRAVGLRISPRRLVALRSRVEDYLAGDRGEVVPSTTLRPERNGATD
jgi:hypothetical protein